MKEIYIVIVFCVLCCLLPSIGLGIYIKWFDDDDDNASGNASGNASDVGSCIAPTGNAVVDYNITQKVETSLQMDDTFNVTGITCTNGNGSATAAKCNASGGDYILSGCSPTSAPPSAPPSTPPPASASGCSSRFPNPTDLTYNLIDGRLFANYDIQSLIELNGDCSSVGESGVSCSGVLNSSGSINCSGTESDSGTILCNPSGIYELGGCGASPDTTAGTPVDCTGSWSACTAVCEPANDRTWMGITAQVGTGAECPAAIDCTGGVGACAVGPDTTAGTPVPDVLPVPAEVPSCNSVPCLNGGTCSMNADRTGYTCICPHGYIGETCEINNLCVTDDGLGEGDSTHCHSWTGGVHGINVRPLGGDTPFCRTRDDQVFGKSSLTEIFLSECGNYNSNYVPDSQVNNINFYEECCYAN